MSQSITENVRRILPVLDEAIASQNDLSALIVKLLQPEPGPYALFHHESHLIERLRDVGVILTRLGEQRHRVNSLEEKESRVQIQRRPGGRLPAEVSRIFKQRSEVVSQMKVDYESLYIFSNLALDQWAYCVAYITGGQDPEESNFHRLTSELRSAKCRTTLRPFRDEHLRDCVWLYYQIRAYRNIFIEHVRRPWQRGHTMTVGGEDFNLFVPTPPGWLQEKEVEEALANVTRVALRWLRERGAEYWQRRNPQTVLEGTFEHIDELDSQNDQQTVWDAWKILGGSTVSFDHLGKRFTQFVADSTKTAREIVEADPSAINLGPSTSQMPKI
jgi:hypothetical protein